ncbi:hypothetical protein C0V78_07735 [Novosphingobium sp. TH158]|nr:hypothetical protein C0V78_07735 [Novosphingobium sp. TH158]
MTSASSCDADTLVRFEYFQQSTDLSNDLSMAQHRPHCLFHSYGSRALSYHHRDGSSGRNTFSRNTRACFLDQCDLHHA